MDVTTAPRRNSKRWTRGTIEWDEFVGWLSEPGDRKESGGYVFGRFKSSTRNNANLIDRCALAIDIDESDDGLPGRVEALGHRAVWHTTWSSTPEALRHRVVIPLSRRVDAQEYHTLVTVVGKQLAPHGGMDRGSVEPARFMFRPATPDPDHYDWGEVGGPTLDPDDYAELTVTTATPAAHPTTKRDPFALPGVIGAFNRAHPSLDELITAFDLPYEPSAEEDRWRLLGTHGEAGVGELGPGKWFSHHTADPAHGEAQTAFDLVRLHKFGDLDSDKDRAKPVAERPSTQEMLKFAGKDRATQLEQADGVFDAHPDLGGIDFLRDKHGVPLDSVHNLDLLREQDPIVRQVYLDEFENLPCVEGSFPWREGDTSRYLRRTDRVEIRHHVWRTHGLKLSPVTGDELIDVAAARNRRNPLREYLSNLVWDGTQRVETCLPGVVPTPTTRLFARKALVAAVARVMQPGIKWDHVLVLTGPEGVGKTQWVNRLARGMNDTLGDIHDKDTLLRMQRAWIMVADEGASLRKADADALKEFITRSEDVFRAPYERESVPHPRHTVIWATTNDAVFLRRQEGNRRWLMVECSEKADLNRFTDEFVDQLWAEAVHLYRKGEQLWLTEEEGGMAAVQREFHTEEDANRGLISEFLDRLVPAGWDDMSPSSRRIWIKSGEEGGTELIETVCTRQLWTEALDEDRNPNRMDLLSLNTIMRSMPGWSVAPGVKRVPHYGPQQVFTRDLF